MIKILIKIVCSIWYFCWGQLFLILFYKKKYIKGQYFKTKYGFTLGSIGWKWIYYDSINRIMSGNNLNVPFPCSPQIRIVNPENIEFDCDNLNNFQTFGNYYQAAAKITIGKGTYIAPNVGLITANHDLNNLKVWSEAKPITIGDNCWIGMNTVVLPGVILGNHTIVGAGSIVTKSFSEGNCIIAGNPAKIIKRI